MIADFTMIGAMFTVWLNPTNGDYRSDQCDIGARYRSEVSYSTIIHDKVWVLQANLCGALFTMLSLIFLSFFVYYW